MFYTSHVPQYHRPYALTTTNAIYGSVCAICFYILTLIQVYRASFETFLDVNLPFLYHVVLVSMQNKIYLSVVLKSHIGN